MLMEVITGTRLFPGNHRAERIPQKTGYSVFDSRGYEDACDYDEYDYTGAYPETNRRPRSSDSRPPRRHYASKGEVEDDYRRKKPIDVSDDS